MGRWSRTLAPDFVDWLECPAGIDWLEVGCGTGALTSAICERANPRSVVACDPAGPFIEYARERLADRRVNFVVSGADDFPLGDRTYMSATSLLALNFFPSPESALKRMVSASAAGAVLSACVWDYSERMEFLRLFWDAAAEISAGASLADEGRRFPLCTPANLLGVFRDVGLHNVCCDALEVSTTFSSFEDYWRPMAAGTGPAPAFVQSLAPAEVERLKDTLQNTVPVALDGSIRLVARAWAVRGTTSAA